ncbi:IS66-like element accessory protein TnpA [Consotaella salsifontis]|uniref:Transposase n=1 Tax=Consotaella salsifontis TaxID=1365950 RepID=A0A1T4S957_9HYPH|nr:transposase [Consotaella salsifontis]SKA24759.1 transposase [Consotaella salsifontis]
MAFRRMELSRDETHRRSWPTSFKEEVVLASLAPDANVSSIAREHDLDVSLVYKWRRRFGVKKVDEKQSVAPFIPVAIGAVADTKEVLAGERPSSPRPRRSRVSIDVSGGRTIRVASDIDPEVLARLLDVVDRQR